MATEAEIDQVEALISAGNFDQASVAFREDWPELWLYFAMRMVNGGSKAVGLENLTISESWNLDNENATSFGRARTHLYAVPEIDQATVTLPITSVFVPERGFVWHIRNGSTSNRLTVTAQGGGTIDGATSIDIEPGGALELSHDGVVVPIDAQDETSYDSSPATEGSFAGGTGHAGSDVITLPDGTLVTVDAVSGGVVTQFTVDSSGSTGVEPGVAVTQSSTTGSGVDFSLTPQANNLTTGRELSTIASSAVDRFARIPLVAADAAAGLLDWTNPFGAALIVSLLLDVTTAASAACTADFGVAASGILSDTLVDGLDLNAAAGVFGSHDDPGTNGRAYRRVAAGDHVTGSVASGASAGLVGNAFISYRFA